MTIHEVKKAQINKVKNKFKLKEQSKGNIPDCLKLFSHAILMNSLQFIVPTSKY